VFYEVKGVCRTLLRSSSECSRNCGAEFDSHRSSPTPALRSRGGRPKGSRNKKTAEKPVDDAPPKPRGRPRGSGPLQKVRAAAEAAGESTEETKRPVGRPPKHPTQPFSVHMGRRVCFLCLNFGVRANYSW
jgi:hypothetical protein